MTNRYLGASRKASESVQRAIARGKIVLVKAAYLKRLEDWWKESKGTDSLVIEMSHEMFNLKEK